jgi:cob(I)alamin adenosyltransferase
MLASATPVASARQSDMPGVEACPRLDHDSEMDDTPETVDLSTRHAAKMAKKKAARDRMMADKAGEKGLIIVHTGAGKGKSSSGFGMILRCVAHGMPCAVVQFIKGAWDTGERTLLTSHFADLCQFHAMGEGFTWETQDRDRDIAAARAGWDKAKDLIRDPAIRMVLLDEINIALRYGYLPLDEVLAFLQAEKPPLTHVVLTGRNAAEALIEAADLVTEMTLVKHPFRSGVKGQPGVEF